ncbi:MAG: LuxR C-terminal-related transcriptional regulator [Candidatus Accumulibacter sp.]|nr:LuxR C-terminal-related transcriptional regulator [Accumulibacter sp.]
MTTAVSQQARQTASGRAARPTRRERFLDQLETIIPWERLLAAIEPHYSGGQNGEGRPDGLQRMLRTVIVQHCFGLSDEGLEEALVDSRAIRRFVGIGSAREDAPDLDEVREFHRLLETNGLTVAIFQAVNTRLERHRLTLREGVSVDARLVGDEAPARSFERNRWRFGMKSLANGKAPDSAPLPGTPHVNLDRPRVDEILAAAMRANVVVICAGAGYGKTHAVQTFLQNYKAVTTWIQLTERDNAGARFWENFSHAVSRINKPLGRQLMEVGFPETSVDFEKYLHIPETDISLQQKHVIVFDDLHLIHDEAVLRFIERSVHTPFPNITTIFVSRVEPGLNLLGQVSTANITEEDLRFTEGEIHAYLRAQGLSVTADTLHEIHEETRGWFLAVNLVARLLQRNPSREFRLRTSLKFNVFKLLESEIFLAVSEDMQRFLIRLSLIDTPSAEIARQLAGDPALFDELTRITAYVRYNACNNDYQIHHLFREYLLQKQGVLTEDEKRETHRVAARWYDENGYWIEAVFYYEKAGDYEPIVRIIHAMPVAIPEKAATRLLAIIEKIPPEIAEGIALFPTAYLRLLTILLRLDEVVVFARRYIEKHEALPPSAFNDRVLTSAYTALAFVSVLRAPDTDVYDFDVYFTKAEAHYSRHPYEHPQSPISCRVGTYAIKVGADRPGAPEEYIDALTRAAPLCARVMGGFMSGLDDLARAELHFYRDEIKKVEHFLERAARTAWENKQYHIYSRTQLYRIRLGFVQGDYDKTEQATRAIERLVEMPDFPNRHLVVDILTAWYKLKLGLSHIIADWLKTDELELGASPRFIEYYGNYVRMEYYFHSGRYAESLAVAEKYGEPKRFLFGRVNVKIREAICLYQMKDREKALEALRQAYEFSRSNHLVMPFIETGKNMRTLTMAAMRDGNAGIPREWLELINRRAGTYAKRQQIIITAYRKEHGMLDRISLSRRETEVLTDLYEGLSRSEIALARNLSINTVKLVINNLYAKLNANNVADVVRIAAEKDLIRGGGSI